MNKLYEDWEDRKNAEAKERYWHPERYDENDNRVYRQPISKQFFGRSPRNYGSVS